MTDNVLSTSCVYLSLMILHTKEQKGTKPIDLAQS